MIESFEIENIEKINAEHEQDEIYEKIRDNIIKLKKNEVNIINIEKEIEDLGNEISSYKDQLEKDYEEATKNPKNKGLQGKTGKFINEIKNENFEKAIEEFENKYPEIKTKYSTKCVENAIKKIKENDLVKSEIKKEKTKEELKNKIGNLEEKKEKLI